MVQELDDRDESSSHTYMSTYSSYSIYNMSGDSTYIVWELARDFWALVQYVIMGAFARCLHVCVYRQLVVIDRTLNVERF